MATNYDIQQMVNSKDRGKIVLSEGEHSIYSDVLLHNGITIEGESKTGTVVNITGSSINAFNYQSAQYTRSHIGVRNMTIRTQYPNNCGVYAVNSGADDYADLVFQGVDRTIHLDRGLGHTIEGIKVETWMTQKVGSLILESTDSSGYVQNNYIHDYQTYFGALDAPIVLHRATNTIIDGYITHAPASPGIVIDDDSQGIVLNGAMLTGVTYGVLVQSRYGRSPQNIDILNTQIDQNTAAGIAVYGGADVRIRGGEISNGFQGVEIGSYPGVERVSIHTDILNQQNNGVVIMNNGKWFDIVGCRISSCGGVAVVLSGGQCNYYSITSNDVSQDNAKYGGSSIIDFSSPVQNEPNRRVIEQNIL